MAVWIAGCSGGGGSTPAKQTATGSVTPEAGGTVALPDESVKLDVPPGAVPADTTITMTTTDGAAPQGITAVSPILQFEPDGIVFAKPITVTFTFKNATNPVVFWSNLSGGFDLIPGTVSGSTISAPVMHFSRGFVGEQPAGSTDKCGAGVACSAGMTCGYGGTTTSGGHAPDGGTATGGATDQGGSTTSGGGSPSGGATYADASAPASTDPGSGPKIGALSSGDGASTGMCCTCTNGAFQCSTCAAPSTGGDDAGAPACAEGASCSQPGASCGTSGGGSTSTGGTAPMSGGAHVGDGAVDASAPAGGSAAPSTGGAVPSSGGTCCTCGSDGHYHCGSSCAGGQPISGHDGGTMTGGADASISGGGSAGASGGGSGGLCLPGDPCQPSAAECKNASPSSCSMCMCGADGKLVCMPCDDGQPPPSDAGAPTGPSDCTPGAACAPGSAGCANDSPGGACLSCQCDASGVLKCGPCGGGADASAPQPPLCVQDGACPAQGMICNTKAADNSCSMCTCGAGGTFQCAPCGADAPPPQADASAPVVPPSSCVQGAKCPAPGATCGGVDQVGACTMCKCGADGTLTCAPCP